MCSTKLTSVLIKLVNSKFLLIRLMRKIKKAIQRKKWMYENQNISEAALISHDS